MKKKHFLLVSALIVAWSIVILAKAPARELRACVAAKHVISEGRYLHDKKVIAAFKLQCWRVQ